jgi:hypothetical protein
MKNPFLVTKENHPDKMGFQIVLHLIILLILQAIAQVKL